MAYVNPRVRSFSQYLMSDDPPRARRLQVRRLRERAAHVQGQEEAGLQGVPAAARGRELRQHRRALGPRAPVPRRRPPSRSRSTRAASAAGASSQTSRRRAPASTRCARRTQGPALPRADGPRRAASATPAPPCARTDTGHPSSLDVRPIGVLTRWADNGGSPILRAPWNAPDAPPRSRSRRRAAGRSLGLVVDTYPFDGGGELEMVVLRLRRVRRAADAARRRSSLDDGRLVAPVRAHQIEDSPGLSTGRHADEDPWRAKTYWYYEDHAVARACARAANVRGAMAPQSGCSGTARPCRTTPSPIRSES